MSTPDQPDPAGVVIVAKAPGTTATVEMIPIEDLLSNAHNPRRTVSASPGLVESIAAVGVIQPLIVTIADVAEDGSATFRVIAGHRRLAAAIKAGLHEVPCVIPSALSTLSDAPDQIVAMLAENSDREGLTTSEEADAYQALLDLGLTPAKVAKKTGRKKADITARLALAAAPEKARTAVDTGRATLDDVAALAEFADDPQVHDSLAEALGTGMFKVRVEMARGHRRRVAEQAATIAALEARGVRAVSWEDLAEEAVAADGDDGERVTDGDDGDETPVYVDEAETIVDEHWRQLDAEPDDPTSDDVRAVLDDYGSDVVWFRRRTDADAAGESPEEAESRARKARIAAEARATAEEQQRVRDELAAAGRVRWTHLAGEAAACTTDHASEVMDAILRSEVSMRLRASTEHAFTRAVLGLPPAEWNLDGIDAEIEEAARAIARMSLPQKVATLYFLPKAHMEARKMVAPESWRAPEEQWEGARLAAWQEELSLEWHYQLADIEHRLIVEGETARAEAAARAAADDTDDAGAADGAA